MKAFLLGGLIGIMPLAACAPSAQTEIWQTGVTPSLRQSDVTQCQVQALQTVPRAMAVGQTPTFVTPTYSTPVQSSCYGSGYGYGYGVNTYASCTSTGGQVYGGQVYGGQIYSYDANQSLRTNVALQCMQQKGYSAISFPGCTADDVKAGRALPMGSPMPAAGNVLCIAKGDQIVLKP